MGYTKEELLGLNRDGSSRKPQKSVHGPGHDGAPKPGFYDDLNGLFVHPGSVPNAARPGETSNHTRATLGVPPKVKRSYTDSTPVHGGMRTTTRGNQIALGGDHKSAVDSLSGDAVVPGAVKSVPGWGNEGARSGHPLVRPPGSKNLKTPEIVKGQRSRTSDHHRVGNIVGEMLLDAAFQNSAPDDCRAHGRTKRNSVLF